MLQLIECRKPDGKVWRPVAIAGSKRDIPTSEILDTVRAKHPAIVNYAIRCRQFANMPGIFDSADHTGRLVVID